MSSYVGKTLYKLDTKGKLREWTITVNTYEGYSEMSMLAGLCDGKKVVNTIKVTAGKNIGKSNETTHYTQALLEAEAKAELQLRSGYVDDPENVKQSVLRSGLPAPMLAQKYHPTGEQKGSKTLAKMKILGKQIVVQPKYDGNRCLIYCNSETDIVMFTRKGDEFPVQLEHIIQDIISVFEREDPALFNFPVILDGELFASTMTFNEVNGLLNRKKSDSRLNDIKYHVYDCMSEEVFLDRFSIICLFETDNIHVVPTFSITATDDEIKFQLERFLAEGHEGLMIRTLDCPYEHKRSWSLVKVKLFEDEEFELLDIEEDARGGFIGAFVMKLSSPVSDRDGNILESFKAGVSGLSQKEGANLLKNKHKYIGKMGTVEFFSRSEYGIPRFGKFKAFRESV